MPCRAIAGGLATVMAVCVVLAGSPAGAAEYACAVPGELARLDQPLAITGKRLSLRQPLTIVALGSSSTAGAGASTPANTYPSRLGLELQAWYPGVPITVINRGVNGEDLFEMLARLDRVLADRPQLVIWQLGTNAVIRGFSFDSARAMIKDGVGRIRAAGAEVVIMNPQYSPWVNLRSGGREMLDLIAAVAREQNVGIFDRYRIMHHWREVDRMPIRSVLALDLLHMNDWSYACVARTLAGAIVDAAGSGKATARRN